MIIATSTENGVANQLGVCHVKAGVDASTLIEYLAGQGWTFQRRQPEPYLPGYDSVSFTRTVEVQE